MCVGNQGIERGVLAGREVGMGELKQTQGRAEVFQPVHSMIYQTGSKRQFVLKAESSLFRY